MVDRLASAALIRAVTDVLRSEHAPSQIRISSVSVPVAVPSPLAWLWAQDAATKVYWSGRDYGLESAGIGIADCQQGSAERDLSRLAVGLRSALANCDPDTRYYGGIRFDPESPHEAHWEPFGAWQLILPRLELRKAALGYRLRAKSRIAKGCEQAGLDHRRNQGSSRARFG